MDRASRAPADDGLGAVTSALPVPPLVRPAVVRPALLDPFGLDPFGAGRRG